MTSAKWLKTWQNARNGLSDLLGRPREQLRPLERSVSDFPELRGDVRVRSDFGGETVGGRVGTTDRREYPEVRGWFIVDFRPALFGRYNFARSSQTTRAGRGADRLNRRHRERSVTVPVGDR
jgi:hypothetical protein